VSLAGCRAVIQQGWSGLGKQELPEGVLTVGYVPHHWLFSRAKCIVHHGGAGTSGAVFRAGIPSVFVPHHYLHDQAFWAKLALELGCAGQSIPIIELTAERLAAAIKSIVAGTDYYRHAGELAKRIQSEPGVRLALRLIEQLLQQIGRPHPDRDPRDPAKSLKEREYRSALRKQFQHNRRSLKK
jgi:UDP:flavonoid glycosyltransferase YjiC (YdhE family)